MLKIEQILLDDKNENVLKDSFEEINVLEKWIIVKRNGKKGLYRNETFQKFLDYEWDKFVFDKGYVLAYKYSQITLFDENGNKILDCNWDKIVFYEKGILATKNGVQGFFDYNGKSILDCVWKRIEPYPQTLVAYRGRGAKRKLFDYDGNLIEE